MMSEEDPGVSLADMSTEGAAFKEPSRLQQLKTVVISGIGFFSDAYDLFVINIVMAILEKEFNPQSPVWKAYVSSAALIGAVLGQIVFGFLADKIGRRKGFIMTLTLVIAGALGSALSFPFKSLTLVYALCVWRFLLGFGIGGEYPLSATITAETTSTKNRGRATAAVFSMQGMGALAAAGVGFLLLTFMDDIDLVWRLCLAIGAIPGLCTFYFRVTMHETERFAQATQTIPNTDYVLILKQYWPRLAGTAGSWFLLDVVFYANGLFSADLLDRFGIGSVSSVHDSLVSIAGFTVLLSLMALPGYWAGVWLIEVPFFGRRNTQILGFFSLAFVYAIIALFYKSLKELPYVFVFLYGVTFFLCNAGANTTTFVLPSEVFPTRVRATFHGLCAAAGKLGAVVGAAAMGGRSTDQGRIPYIFVACGLLALAGAFLTMAWVPETRGKSLEQLTDEVEGKAFELVEAPSDS